MKKTCYGCKALDGHMCNLNFRNEIIYVNYSAKDVKPLEECPKPKTIKDFIKHSSNQ